MGNSLKLKDGKELEIKFTPRTMARLQAETGKTVSYFLGIGQHAAPYAGRNDLTAQEQIAFMERLGFEDLKFMIFAGCPEVDSLNRADEILDELEDSFVEAVVNLMLEFVEFMNCKMVPKGAIEQPDPTKQKQKEPPPEKPQKKEATKKVE